MTDILIVIGTFYTMTGLLVAFREWLTLSRNYGEVVGEDWFQIGFTGLLWPLALLSDYADS